MNDQNFSLKGIIQTAKEYFENWKRLSKLILIERISAMISGILINVFLVFLGVIIFLFLSIALALYLGSVTGSAALGFLLVSAIYVLLFFIVGLTKSSIETKLINISIQKIFKKWEEEDEI